MRTRLAAHVVEELGHAAALDLAPLVRTRFLQSPWLRGLPSLVGGALAVRLEMSTGRCVALCYVVRVDINDFQ